MACTSVCSYSSSNKVTPSIAEQETSFRKSAQTLVEALYRVVWQNTTSACRHVLSHAPSSFWKQVHTDWRNYSPVHLSAAMGNEEMTTLLLESGFPIDARDANGNTALIWAASEGKNDVVLSLLEQGANPNFQNLQGQTALFLAAAKGLFEVVECLTENCANPHLSTVTGETALHTATGSKNVAVVEFLLQHGAHLNAQDEEGDTPLHWAVREGQPEMMKLLLKFGADATVSNADGESAWDLANDLGESREILTTLHQVMVVPMCTN